MHPFDRARQEAQLIRMKRNAYRPRLLVAYDIDDSPVAIEDRNSGHFTLSHFVAIFWSLG
jgi:hypothetical protein